MPASSVLGEDLSASRKAEARRWFEDAKFGLFVHWGVSTLVGKGEWMMEHDRIPISEYEKLPPLFHPTEFNARRWVTAVREAGQRSLTITAKGHDGFCLFDSALTDYDVVDATPYRKDPLKELADACHEQGIKLFFYYSLLDWHHPDYFPRGQTGRHAGRAVRGDWSRYVAYYQGQVRELCTRYGEIGGVWFDGCWDRPGANFDLERTYKIVHDLQPGALVGNNHHGSPRPGEDFQFADREIAEGEKDPSGSPPPHPLVTCLPLNGVAGSHADNKDKDDPGPATIIHHLLGAAGRGASLFLSVGPGVDGALGPEVDGRLREVGKWLDESGESVYGTRRGPIPPQPWGVALSKTAPGGGTVYLHVIRPELAVTVPRAWLPFDARLGAKPGPLNQAAAGDEVVISLSEEDRTPLDTIIVLKPRGTP